ncbi:hypothetical protein CXB51_005730 [Gossypium anomalum]|uniref:DUF4219 domain-containing protein n=1 Tax=Gossypium anomalum TaxID=47600 RepID=A0A8J5ZI63_9ROSI|nr:hypothetical protein CXB51_005730 [Gossypium anomalum]
MASEQNFTILGEGHSTIRHPLFNGTNYSYWRIRMKLFIQANDYEVWRIVTNGPSILIKRVEDVVVPKEDNECDENDIKKSPCVTMQKMWDKLEITHEGTSRVRESKISILTIDYELFKTKPEEGIKEMSDRFAHIINGKALGKSYPNKEMVKKMLNSLPASWEPKLTVIEESKDLNSLFLDELIGSLLTYEMKINYNAKEISTTMQRKSKKFQRRWELL